MSCVSPDFPRQLRAATGAYIARTDLQRAFASHREARKGSSIASCAVEEAATSARLRRRCRHAQAARMLFHHRSVRPRAFLSGSSSRRGPQGARTRCRCGTLATRPRTATTSHLHLGSRLRRRSQPCGDPPQYRHQAESTSKLGSDFALSATMNGSAYRPASRRWAIAPTLDTSKRNRPQLPQRRR